MYQSQREEQILQLLSASKYMSVKELSACLAVSESSIRRSLTALEQKGILTRSYGGAELIETGSHVTPFSVRARHNSPAKKAMARKAAALVRDNDVVFLDQSSSALYVAQELLQKRSVTVITNNLEILLLLADSDLAVWSSGGALFRKNRTCLLGEDACAAFEQTRADIVFFSTKALTADGTILDYAREEVCIRRCMLRNAARRVFLCDSEKVGGTASYKQGTLADVDCLICEEDLTDRFQAAFPQLTIL